MMFKKIILLGCIVLFCSFSNAQNRNKFDTINWRIYHQLNFSDYVDIKSPEWRNLGKEDKKALLQIPNNELIVLSTNELMEAYLNSAYARSFFLYSEVEDYYEQLYQGFNGFRELLDRPDVAETVIEYYREMDPQSNSINSSGISIPIQIQFIEYLIGYPKLVEKFNSEQVRNISAELLKKHKIILNMEEVPLERLESNIYAISRVLSRDEFGKETEATQIEGISALRKTGRIPNEKVVSEIMSLFNQ